MAIPKKTIYGRKLLIHAINRLIATGFISLDENIKCNGLAMLDINGYPCAAEWWDAGHGELKIRVWGNINFDLIREYYAKIHAEVLKENKLYFDPESDTIVYGYKNAEELTFGKGLRHPDSLTDFQLLFNGRKQINDMAIHPDQAGAALCKVVERDGIAAIEGNFAFDFTFDSQFRDNPYDAKTSCWFERKTGKYIMGDRNSIPGPYAPYFSRNRTAFIESLPDIAPLGFEPWGKFFC